MMKKGFVFGCSVGSQHLVEIGCLQFSETEISS